MYELSFLKVLTRIFYFSKEFLAFEKVLKPRKKSGAFFFEKNFKKVPKNC